MRRATAFAILAISIALFAALPQGAFASNPDLYGFKSVTGSLTTHQAGAHPDFTAGFEISEDPDAPLNPQGLREPADSLRDFSLETPPGLIANPHAVAQCSIAEFQAATVSSGCPLDAQVGSTEIAVFGLHENKTFSEPVFMLPPPGGDSVARIGFWAFVFPVYVNIKLRADGDYGLTAAVEGAAAPFPLRSTSVTLWGVPADPSHDPLRVTVKEADDCIALGICPEGHQSGLSPAAFMTNPTSCGEETKLRFSTDGYGRPNHVDRKTLSFGSFTGCESVAYAPTLTVTPTTHEAGAPTGVDVELRQPPNETANGLATAQLRDAKVTLPPGMTIAAGAADGLQACSAAQAHYRENRTAECPEASKLGSLELEVPALSAPIHGGVYQRDPVAGDLFRIWLIADELGAHVKLPGEVHVDKQTGQISSIFLDNPQVPFEILRLHFREGPRAALANPPTCGTHLTHYEFTPWSGNATVLGDAPMRIDSGCGAPGFNPRLSAGTTQPFAGQYSPFVLDVKRESSEQNVSRIATTLPVGLTAKLAGVPLCEGAAAQSGSCSAASQVGTATAATGPGGAPLWIPQPGKAPTAVYLGGPYEGEPLSLVVKVPAQAGPFDLGDVVTRAAIHVDPLTAQVTATSDPLPQMLEGVPVSYRTIHVDVDRPNFMLNPTSCGPKQLSGRITSIQGSVAGPTDRFQVGGCAGLGFKPRLALKLVGGTKRGAHPAVHAVLRPRAGDANLSSTVVRLPHSAFLDQAHIRTICTRVQYAQNACPAGSVYGHVTAYTPLLDEPLEGPIFLRSSNHKLPDLVLSLHGTIDVEAVARIDSIHGGIRSSFTGIPDAPLSKVVVDLEGAKKGLIVNSTDICKGTHRAQVSFGAQNGSAFEAKPALQGACSKPHHAKH